MSSATTTRPAGHSALAEIRIQPLQVAKRPPCSVACPGGADIRGWITTIGQRRRLRLSDGEAYARAWSMVTAVNPFPATMGRICPHPCQLNCSRAEKDGAVAINALERYLGDWGLTQGLKLPRLAEPGSSPESIGVIGSGPAGLSFAYQMVRRGYAVTIYEKESKPGGMLYYGIPEYRLPEAVLEAEVRRILDLGVELQLDTAIGHDLDLATLRSRHDILFLGIGAGLARRLGIPGEEGDGAWTGTEYLARVNRGQAPELGGQVVVVGGGNTAVDAARMARRSGAGVTMLYRRTRVEMPAIEAEVDDALAEGIRIEFLAAPVKIVRVAGSVRAVVVQRMELGEPDSSGRRSPVPLAGFTFELPVTSIIAAVSQQPDWERLKECTSEAAWAADTGTGTLAGSFWTGGDIRGPGIASQAIGQGRQAAETVHARLRGLESSSQPKRPLVRRESIKPDFYPHRLPVVLPRTPADHWRAHPERELVDTISDEEFLQEIGRCFSCGLCYGCEQCFMYCSGGGFTRLEQGAPGAYFALSLERCQSCGKCIDLCPSGFLTPT